MQYLSHLRRDFLGKEGPHPNLLQSEMVCRSIFEVQALLSYQRCHMRICMNKRALILQLPCRMPQDDGTSSIRTCKGQGISQPSVNVGITCPDSRLLPSFLTIHWVEIDMASHETPICGVVKKARRGREGKDLYFVRKPSYPYMYVFHGSNAVKA